MELSIVKKDLVFLLEGLTDKPPSHDIKWDELSRIAEYSKVLALLFYKVKGRKEELAIPEDAYLKAEKAYQVNAIRNTFILEEFERLMASFKDAHVRCIPLKGIHFLRTLYRDKIGIRRMEDIDILVREEGREGADKVLRHSGYHLPPGRGADENRKASMYFKKDDNGFMLAPVHLHWHIINLSSLFFEMNWSKIKIDDIWDSSVLLDGKDDGNVFIMSPEHMLLALSSHSLSHGFARLGLLYDIHSHICHYAGSISWDKLAELAAGWGLVVPLRFGVLASVSTFGTHVPEDFLRKLRPENISFLEKWFLRYISKNDRPQEDMGILLYMAMNRALGEKAKFLFTAINSRISKRGN